MSTIEELLQVYNKDERTQQVISSYNIATPTIQYVSGIVGAQDCFVLSACTKTSDRKHIYIASNKEDAAYIYTTLSEIKQPLNIHFFPDSFKRPRVYESIDKNNVLQRTETINKITQSLHNQHIVITYPEALFEKVVDPKYLKKDQVRLLIGEELDVDQLINTLIKFRFERTEFVYEPGQFSIRGGIIDIFSYGNEWPYRIELFDEEIESIRSFDPGNQLSIKSIKSVTIIPNINNSFDSSQKVSLLHSIPKDTVFWLSDVDFLLDSLQDCFEKVEILSGNININDEDDLKTFYNERAFIFPNDIIEDLGTFNLVLLKRSGHLISIPNGVEYRTRPQPSFNRNFNLLIADLEKNTSKHYGNYIFTDSAKQVERFYKIFEDLNAKVDFKPITEAIHKGFVDDALKIAAYTDHQIFDRFHRYKLRRGFTKSKAISLQMLRSLEQGDFVTHIDHGVGRYSGLEKININGHVQESIRLVYLNNDILYVSINSLHKISKFVGKDGSPPRLNKIGGDTWSNLKRKTKRKVKDIAGELIQLYAKRKASQGFAFKPDGYMQNELEASFIYQDTPDQLTTTIAVKEDMMKENPMDRLVCGDVGFGKTEIAVRAAFKAVVSGKQVAILVPTTILALQHFRTFDNRLKEFGITVDYLNRFRTSKEKRIIYERLEEGKIEIIIGTHALLNQKIKFKDLGLLVIDEEQKFGVAAKEKLRNIKVNVDTLTLTATPIPRTLQFSLMSARDLSVIRTPPPNRQPIYTERRLFSVDVVREAIYFEINRGGQVFFVHNRVKNLPDIAAMIQKACPDIRIRIGHGQMDAKKLEGTLIDFIDHKYDVLVSTSIIETGLDIPNANTMIINNAHHFGMSDLHQLRGRIGRSNRKAFCYLFAPPLSVLTDVARKRLQALEEHTELGSGFQIAMRDLDIRGAGNILGGEQSGFISDIGYQTYQKILEQAVQELKETQFKQLFKEQNEKRTEYVYDVEIDADVEMLIPDNYISNIQERLNLYTELDHIKTEEAILLFQKRMADRFGAIPKEVFSLFDVLRLRWICKKMGFERLSLKESKLRCFFIRDPQSAFYETVYFTTFLKYITTNSKDLNINLKQTKTFLILIKEDVESLKEAHEMLIDIYDACIIK